MYTNYAHEKGLRQAAPIQNTQQNEQLNCTTKAKDPTKTQRVIWALKKRSYNPRHV